MGSYLNPGNFSFRGSLRSKIYVDKSELIAKTNEALCTEQRYICVSRPRDVYKRQASRFCSYVFPKPTPGSSMILSSGIPALCAIATHSFISATMSPRKF